MKAGITPFLIVLFIFLPVAVLIYTIQKLYTADRARGDVAPKIVDAFTFYNELDMLEIRLAELYNVVDFFVLVEATETFQGSPKPLYFDQNRARFKKYAKKIGIWPDCSSMTDYGYGLAPTYDATNTRCTDFQNHAANSAPWVCSASMTDADVCKWVGVKCEDNNQIVSVVLSTALKGVVSVKQASLTIPSELGLLTSLQTLD